MKQQQSILTDTDIKKLEKKFATKSDLQNQESRLERKLENTKDEFLIKMEAMFMQFKSDIFTMIDPILKEVVASREERVIVAHQISGLENRVERSILV